MTVITVNRYTGVRRRPINTTCCNVSVGPSSKLIGFILKQQILVKLNRLDVTLNRVVLLLPALSFLFFFSLYSFPDSLWRHSFFLCLSDPDLLAVSGHSWGFNCRLVMAVPGENKIWWRSPLPPTPPTPSPAPLHPTTKLWVKALSLMHIWATCCPDNGRGILFWISFFFLSTIISVSSYVLNAPL